MSRPGETRREEPGFDVLEIVILAAVTAAALAVALPALVVAVPLGMAIENGGWRRWPAVAAGTVLTGLIVLAGGWDAYHHTVYSVWAHLRFHHPFRPVELLALLPLGSAGGILAAPLLPALLHHRNEHEATRHYRELSHARRGRTQAQRAVGRTRSWPEPEGRTVLGVPLGGAIRNWRLASQRQPVVAAPLDVWRRQALIVGETGSGKTVTALALAGEALRGGWDVYWIDGKADPATAREFLALTRAAGVDARDGTREPLDGWRGDPEAIVNRLLATQVFTEPYYEGVARSVLRRAVGERPPHSFSELVARLDKRALQRAARHDPEALEAIRALPEKDVAGVRARYDGIAWAVGTTLDGTWSYEDTRAAYVPVGRPENRHQAAEVGAFLLEDILHWALARKPPDRQALVVVDEFSKLSDRPGAAVDLVERARSFNVAVVLIAQAWASLGPDDTIRNTASPEPSAPSSPTNSSSPTRSPPWPAPNGSWSGRNKPRPWTTPDSGASGPGTATSSTPTTSAASTKAKRSSSTEAKPSSSESALPGLHRRRNHHTTPPRAEERLRRPGIDHPRNRDRASSDRPAGHGRSADHRASARRALPPGNAASRPPRSKARPPGAYPHPDRRPRAPAGRFWRA